MPRLLELGEGVGAQEALVATCECSPDRRLRKLPIWVQTTTAAAIGRQLKGVLRDELVVFTFRCKCGRKIAVTIDDLFKVDSEPFNEAVNGGP